MATPQGRRLPRTRAGLEPGTSGFSTDSQRINHYALHLCMIMIKRPDNGMETGDNGLSLSLSLSLSLARFTSVHDNDKKA